MSYPSLQTLTWLPETDLDVNYYVIKVDEEEVATVNTSPVDIVIETPGIHMITVEAYELSSGNVLTSRCFYRFYNSGARTRIIGRF